MSYHIDLSTISLKGYKEKLKTGYLPPSRKCLLENLDERLNVFEESGINNVKELIQALKDKKKFLEYANMDSFSEEYLKILLRELNSILPKPNKLKEFDCIPVNVIEKLEKINIKNTAKLYDEIINPEKRKALAAKTSIEEAETIKLTKLTDLSRIRWVGVKFAQMLLDLGVDTVEKASKAKPEELHKMLNNLSKEKKIYKAEIGLRDIEVFVDAAKEVPLAIKY